MTTYPTLLARLWARQGQRCFYCDTPTRLKGGNALDTATRDHVFTSVERNQYPEHIRHISVMACRRCNEERGQLPAHDYILVHGFRIEQEQQKYLEATDVQ